MRKATQKEAKRRPANGPIRVAVIVSDLHCGSTLGLLPPRFVTLEENPVSQSPLQAHNWAIWEAETKRLISDPSSVPFALIVNGDATEGIHHGGRQTISADPSDHLRAAVQTLEPLASAATAVFVTLGTECHTHSLEHALAKQLGAIPQSPTRPAFDVLKLTINGVPCTFSHHIGTSMRLWTKGTALSSMMAHVQLNEARAGMEVSRFLAFAHCHTTGLYSDGRSTIITTGAWQGKTRHGHKVANGSEESPSIGKAYFDGPFGSLPRVHLEQLALFPEQRQAI